MKIQLLLIFILGFSFVASAQESYTYMTNKKFNTTEDLIGYNFVPNEMEIPNEGSEELAPDDYSFGISRNNLYVSGGDLKGVYNINNFNSTEYGYKLTLINARDPREQGHLKVILVGRNYVDALVFKKSTDEKELIFFLPQMSDELKEEERDFYTDRTEIELLETDSIWGTKILPFFRVYTKGNIHERLYSTDSTWISFVEEIEIIEKIKEPKVKKEKSSLRRTGKKKRGDFNIETGKYEGEESDEEEEEYEEEENEVDEILEDIKEEESLSEEEPIVKTKIIKKYFIDFRTIITKDDGTINDIRERYNVKKIKEREDEAAELHEERFQIELETNKGLMHLYLNGNRMISSFEMNGEQYLMRGH